MARRIAGNRLEQPDFASRGHRNRDEGDTAAPQRVPVATTFNGAIVLQHFPMLRGVALAVEQVEFFVWISRDSVVGSD